MKPLSRIPDRSLVAWMRGGLAALAIGLLASCGSDGEQVSVVNGAIVKGPVVDATVCAHELLPTGKGRQLGCTTTDREGRYSLRLGYSGEVIVEATGGTYTDEGTGALNVPLTFPLNVAGLVLPGTQTLVATPLTSRALSLLVAKGALTAVDFDAESARVAADLGLVLDTRLSEALPIVTAGNTNAYGDVLIGLSTALSPGAMASYSGTLHVSAWFYGAFSSSGSRNSFGICSRLGIYVNDAGDAVDGVAFTVVQPAPSWLALLPEAGAVMGCQLTFKTTARVDLTCPMGALASGYTLIGEGALSPVPDALPYSGVLVAGRSITGIGKLSAAGPGILDAGYVNAGSLAAIPGSGSSPEQHICGTPGALSYVYSSEALQRRFPVSPTRIPGVDPWS